MRKSKEHLEHVRTFTGESLKVSINQDNDMLFGIPLFILGDLYTTLVCVAQTVSLVVLQSTGIENNDRKISELELEKSSVKLSGQILHLMEHTLDATLTPFGESSSPTTDKSKHNNSSLLLADTSAADMKVNMGPVTVNMSNRSVIWTGDYIKFNLIKAKKDKGNLSASQPSSSTVSHNALLFSVPSQVTERISGTLIETAALSEIESGGVTREKILELGMSFNNTFPYIINQGTSYIPSHHYVNNHHHHRSSNCCH